MGRRALACGDDRVVDHPRVEYLRARDEILSTSLDMAGVKNAARSDVAAYTGTSE